MEQNNQDNSIIKLVILSIFEEDGPIPVLFWPINSEVDDYARHLIAMKTISLLMGDAVYQDGTEFDEINYFGILPFPDLKLEGLTYFFLIFDENARGKAKAATVTILIEETKRSFFYENMKYLRVVIDKTATNIQHSTDVSLYEKNINTLVSELTEFCDEIKEPFTSTKRIKIIFSGLDRAGKSSFLLAVRKKYSEIIKTLPTKGVERSDEKIFKEQNSQISIWDLGGQKKYREKYLEQSKLYLYNVDLLFFMIDVQDIDRADQSIELFKDIINSIKNLDEYPPVIVCLNKFDPDLKDTKEINKNSKNLIKQINKHSDKFIVKIFQTSIFDYWSVISAYSYGLAQLSPNREFFKKQLKYFAEKTDATAILLLNENGIILSDHSTNEIDQRVFEISAPHFQTLYKTFKEFKLLKKDFIVSSGIITDTKRVIFKRIQVDKYDLYLLLFMEEAGLEKIDVFLPSFSKNLIELMSTYI